jgi:hypothetical protein
VLTAYLNNTQNDNILKKDPIHVRGKGGSKEKRKETKVKERVNQIESPMGKERKKKPKEKTMGLKMVCQS